MTRTPYQIAGQGSAWICDFCVNLRAGLWMAGAVVMLLVFGANAYIAFQEGNTPNTVCCGITTLLTGIVGPIAVLRGRSEIGGHTAIAARKETLEGQGYNAFFSTSQYKRLR